MDDPRTVAINYLRRLLEANEAEMRGLAGINEHLRASIREFESLGGSDKRSLQIGDPVGKETPVPDGDVFQAVFAKLERIEAGKYPAVELEGLTRVQIAVKIARDFEGFITPNALRRVLAQPGVLRSAKQVASVSSRVLKNSDEFKRVWEGLYRLRDYESR